jgi:acyl transferase domain-containing protein/thioesterase domain-containing protein
VTQPDPSTDSAIAVIGMAVRLPGAPDVARFWANLAGGVESITIGPAPRGLVAAAAVLDGIERFDAALFGYTPGEAAELDPQQRIFLECAWTALESAGYPPQSAPLRAGVYGGASFTTYLFSNLLPAAGDASASVLSNRPAFADDFLATRVAYELGLTGPAVTVQTTCSTSLVAIHVACQALLAGECELALAGGVRIAVPQLVPYPYQEGGVLSADGHCRAFDARSTGTVPGNGAAIVVLKRLADALADGDPIRAVVLGTAINNDGSAKAGFAAPSVDGQAGAIRDALAIAGVAPAEVSYIEAHGTGTPLGDPIELAALKQVFAGAPRGACGIGTVKSNLGHLDAAAGVAGFIKAVLALEHRTLPPSLHFTAPNPQLGIEDSPFHVVAERRAWTGPRPLRAGVSSFGIGGTNAHAVLQEPPARTGEPAARRDELIVISARTRAALDRMTGELADFLRVTGEPLADIAHTLQIGRKRFAERRYAVGGDPRALAEALARPGTSAPASAATQLEAADEREAVFVFPGGGVQRIDMASALRDEPAFRAAFDDCAGRAAPLIGADLGRVVYPEPAERDAMARALDGTVLSQPAIFAVNWAIAHQWLAWGVAPRALLGHSLGEYVAACLAGVFSLDDALRLVTARGQILARLPPGAMVSVLAPPARVEPLLGGGLVICAINGPQTCVVAGLRDAIDRLEAALAAAGIEFRRLRYASASHTPLLDEHLAGFERLVAGCALRPPAVRVVSTVTGAWLTAEQATDPAYWRRQFRAPVQFSAALATLLSSGPRTVIEAGPAATLSALIRQHPAAAGHAVVATLPATPGPRRPLDALGDAWAAGAPIDWRRLRGDERRRRVALPTYSFDRERHWVDPPDPAPQHGGPAIAPAAHRPAAAPPAARPGVADPAGPRDATERAVLACFRDLFHIQDIGVGDNFFALGGDSLLAGRLMALIAHRCDVRLPLKAVAEAPTAAALARRIAAESPGAPRPAAASCLAELQPGRGTPVFLVHGAGGYAMFYRDLAHAIDPERTIYGFEARGLDGREPMHGSVEDMAAHYVELARAAHPGGPYLLAGASFGGMLAYEMARQLTARGTAVALCAMIDAPGPGYLPDHVDDDTDILAPYLDRMVGIRADELRGRSLDDQLAAALAAADARGIGLAFSDVETGRRLMAVWKNNYAVMARYTAPPWPGGEAQFFSAAEPSPGLPAHLERAWIGRCAVRVEVVPGDHLSMVAPPHAASLGARIRACLTRTGSLS